MLRIERAHSTHRVTWWTLLGLLLVPLVIAGGLLAATRPATTAVSAAIVNLDEAVTIEGQIVPMGRQLAAAIVEREENATWTLSDLPRAESGLAKGEYAAIVVIPKAFSAAATSFSANDAASARQATIEVRVGRNSPVTDARIAQQVARIASDVLSSTLTEGYLDRIYVGFNTMGEQFVTITDGARQLATGSGELRDGLAEARDGSAQLATGARELAGGMPQLVSGIGQLAEASTRLTDGVGQFADGSVQVVGGVGQLGAGLRAFESKVRSASPDVSGLAPLQAGARQLSRGVDTLSDTLKLLTVAKLPSPGGKPMPCPVDDPETCKVFDSVLAALQKLADGKLRIPPEVFDKITCPVDDPKQCAVFDQVVGLIKDLATTQGTIPPDIIKGFDCPVTDQVSCVLLLRTYLAGFQTGTGLAWAALNAPDPASGVSLRGGARQLADGVDQLVAELPKQAKAQQAQLADGIGEVAAGAERLASGSQALVASADQLKQGMAQFDSGMRTLSDKVAPLPEGTGRLADGAERLAEGLRQAATGSGQLTAGLEEFASRLSEGADQVPSYSADDRAALSKVVARPILTDRSLLSSPLGTLLSVLFAAAIWLGAMANYLVMRPIPSRVLTSSRPTWQLTGAALLPGVAIAAMQAVVFAAAAGVVLGLAPGWVAAAGAVLLVAGVSFVAVNHAIAAWAGGWGRLAFLALATLAVAAGLASGVPGWVSTLAGLSPVTPALQALRGLGTGASLTNPVAGLLLWLVIGLVAGHLAISRHRQLSPAQFLRRSP